MTVRSALPTVYLLAAGAALALALAAIPYIGTAGATSITAAEPLAEVIAAPEVTPVTLPTVEEVAAPWRRGDYLAAGLLLLGGVLILGLRLDPKRAALYTGALAAFGACIDLAANGRTPNASMVIGALVGFGFWIMRSPLTGAPKPVPIPEPPRKPELGAARLGPLLWLALLALASAIALAVTSCSSVAKQTRASAGHVVDCTADAIRDHAAAYGARVEASITAATVNGVIDWERVGEDVAELAAEVGLEVAGCAALRTVADMLERPSAAPVDRRQIEAGWAHVQRQHLGGRVYEGGTVRP